MKIVCLKDYSSASIRALIDAADSEILFVGDQRASIEVLPRMFERMATVMRETRAGWVYSDSIGHARIDYQRGSIRDNFDFGPVVAIAAAAAREVSLDDESKWGALYELRLRISEKFPIVRIPEALYAVTTLDQPSSEQKQFEYVDPRNRDYQIEMERIASAHLKRIGGWLAPDFQSVSAATEKFPVKASIVIPVRNRERTVLDAIQSALAQRTDFSFNVIVVDNHSTDRTTELVRGVHDSRLVQIVPRRSDLGIGGCWNEAIYSQYCGQYAVQLDSDDLYRDETGLNRIITALQSGPYAMVIGSYTMVDFALREIPPGLIDHREWSRDNGRNNALRINGLGAPRAFDTAIVRRFGFPNVSYGEDYAVALRISRDFEIGRIYDSLYLCRRWEGNSDSALPHDVANRYDHYKDWLRTVELEARIAR